MQIMSLSTEMGLKHKLELFTRVVALGRSLTENIAISLEKSEMPKLVK